MIKAYVINITGRKVDKRKFNPLQHWFNVKYENLEGWSWLAACNKVLKREPDDSLVLLIHPEAEFFPEAAQYLVQTVRSLPQRYKPIKLVGPITDKSTGLQQRKIEELKPPSQLGGGIQFCGYLNPHFILVHTPFQFDPQEETLTYIRLWREGFTMVLQEGAAARLPAPERKTITTILESDLVDQEVKIAGLMRAKVTSQNLRWFERALHSLIRATDKVFVFDDGSEIEIKSTGHVEVIREPELQTEEAQREFLASYAKLQGFTWAVSLDADEEFEEDRETLRKYLSRLSPTTHSLFLRILNTYNDTKYFRIDGVFGNHGTLRIFRLSNAKIRAVNPNIHTGSSLFYPTEYRSHSCLRIIHHGFLTPEMRKQKYEWYKSIDPYPIPEIAGYDNYEWLLDEEQIVIKPLVKRKTCTLAQVVKNEEQFLGEFYNTHAALFDKIKVVDTGSTDSTLRILQHFTNEYEVFNVGEDFPGFDVIRNKSIEGIDTDYTCYLDPDERIEDPLKFLKTFDHSTEAAFLFYVKNVLKDGRVSLTETIRLWPTRWNLRFNSFVHETVDRSVVGHTVLRHPVAIVHFGYLKPNVPEKILWYENVLRKGLEKDPNDEKLWWALALYEIERDNNEKAIEYLKKSVAINPDFFLPYKELALVYIDAAIEALEKTLTLIPRDHAFYNQLSALLAELKEIRPPKIRVFT